MLTPQVLTLPVSAPQVKISQESTLQVATTPVWTPQVRFSILHVAFFAAFSASSLAFSSFNILAVLMSIIKTYPLSSILAGSVSFIIQASFNALRCFS